jgi:hypothetical protein
MSTSRLQQNIYRDLYIQERHRRDQIRQSVSTPVAALAFSVFNIGTLSVNYDPGEWNMTSIIIAALAAASILLLVAAAILIIRVELGVYYYDPPDLKELLSAEQAIKKDSGTDDEIEQKMTRYIIACYDIAYRRYFSANEKAAHDRTNGLHLIILALVSTSLAYLFIPFQ